MQRQHERAAPASDPRCALSEGELMSVWNEVVREIESFAADVGSLRVNEPPTPESVRRDVESMVDFERAIPLDELTRRVADAFQMPQERGRLRAGEDDRQTRGPPGPDQLVEPAQF